MAKHITDVAGQPENTFVTATIGTHKPSKGRYAGKTCHDVITLRPATRRTKGAIMLKSDDIVQLHEYIQRNLANGAAKTVVYKSNKNHDMLMTMLRFESSKPVASKSIEAIMAEAEAENAKRDEQSIEDAMIEAEARNAEFDKAATASDNAPSLRKALLTELAKHGYKAVLA